MSQDSARLTPADLIEAAAARRVQRHLDREYLWGQSSLDRVRRCGRVRITAERPVSVHRTDTAAHYSNLQFCGSVWACPCCSSKIRFQRSGEVLRILAGHLDTGTAAFVTQTVPHSDRDTLAESFSDVADAQRAMTKSRRWSQLSSAIGLVGYVRTAEVTWSPANGWHPHLHSALLFDRSVDLPEFEGALYELWAGAVEKQGRGRPSRKHGVDVRPIGDVDGIAQYIAKVEGAAMELTFADRKKGKNESRSPQQILRDARIDGDVADRQLIREYEKVTKGRRMLNMSRGLKQRHQVVEVDDQEIAEREVGGELLLTIDGETWRGLTQRRGATTQLLTVAFEQGLEGSLAYISESINPLQEPAL